MNKYCSLLIGVLLVLTFSYEKIRAQEKSTPIIVITDLYQDPGDNMDLIMGFGLPDVNLKAILLDITDSFRKEIADHPTLWKDPRGPREGGVIPIEQLKYIFNKNVPYAMGPLSMMKSESDRMEYLPHYEQEAINLLLNTLKKSNEPIEIVSFGSARILAVAYNRNPNLMKKKIKKIHLSAGTANNDDELGNDSGANAIPGGEWNVALDVFAFNRILKSDLPVAIYPCAGKDGAFVKDTNNTYWKLPNMNFIYNMHIQLQHYLNFAFTKSLQYDFLYAMDSDYPTKIDINKFPQPFHIWESAIWLIATKKEIICNSNNEYQIIKKEELKKNHKLIINELRPCILKDITENGRFKFIYTSKASNKEIYYRTNLKENEKAFQQVIPQLYISITPKY